MSLINDALKRANQARPSRPVDAADFPPLRPALGNVRAPIGVTILAPAALLLVFAAALWVLWQGWNLRRHDPEATVPATVVVQAATLPAVPTAPAASAATPALSEAVTAPAPSTPAALANSLAVPPAIETPIAPTNADPAPPPPALKLQGIFYQPRNPSVLINNKTLFLGDVIQNATVVAVDRGSVTLVEGGRTNILTLD